ncbi:MAG: PAS domain S-box protein [Tildeniella nuda ZEHNDER 1965/U140]|jgi:PAS domain S-box-containing protein|nr:PAS domain S-box protein [Tildeniella nuda ZEHNDER 1965/U140]
MHNESAQSQSRGLTVSQRRSLKVLPLKLAGAYFIVAVLWIISSDFLLATLAPHPAALNRLQSIKGLLFVSVTAWALYWLARRSLRTLQQTETTLRESEERLRLVLQNMPVMLNAFDEQGNIIVWNQECARVTGYSTEEIIGNPQAMTWLYPDVTYRQQMVADWTERGNDYRDWEWDLVCKDGSHRTVAWSTISDRFPIPGWISWGIGVDVTDRKRTEANLQTRNRELLTLHRISEITLNQQSLKAAFQDIVKEISVATAFPIIAIELYDATRQVMVFEGTEGISLPPDGKPIEVPVTQTSSGNVVQTGQMLVKTYDSREPKKCDSNESLRKLGIKTFICVPMTVNQTTIGVLSLAHPEVVPTEEGFLHWLTSLANYLALLTDRKRSEVALLESELQFRSLSACSPVGIYLASPEGYGTYTNPRCQEIFGCTLEESIGGGWAERVHPDDREWVFQEWTAAATAGKAYRAEYRVQPREGVVRWVQTRSAAMYSDAGRLTGHVGTIEDITDRKQAEAQIRQLNQTLEQQNLELEALVEQRTAELMTFINTLPDYIFVVERDTMRTLFSNDRNAWLGDCKSHDQMVGKTIFECYASDLAATFAEQNRQVFESGETLHFQENYTTTLGTFHFDTYKIPLKKPNGEVYALIGSSRNVTDLVAARQALSDRTAQLEIVNRELESFSYSVSHDLRAPLRHIGGFVTALTDRLQQDGYLNDPTTARYLQIIQNSSHKMGALIDGLLMLSRVGRRQMADTRVDLDQLVTAVLAQRPEVTTSSTTETVSDRQPVQFSIGALPTVKGDATLLQQVFVNLLDNAIKFSRHRQPAHIEIGALSDGIIFVRDRGVGFQMQYADQLFGAFQRLHSQSEFEGSGIGLAIVQRIIHRHGGKIWAESQPDQGATFYFTLGDRLESLGQAK